MRERKKEPENSLFLFLFLESFIGNEFRCLSLQELYEQHGFLLDCTKINEKEKDLHFTSKTFKIILTWLKYVVKDEYIREQR